MNDDSSSLNALRKTLVKAVAIAAALLMVTILTMTRSEAAFSDTTSNVANSIATGDVVLTDDDTALALFDTAGLTATDSVAECLNVSYTGSIVPATIRAYGTSGGSLDAFLDMTVEMGTGGGYGDCASFTPGSTIYTGTVSGFSATHADWATGLATFTAATNPDNRTFRFTLTVQDDNAAQGLATTMEITFEAQP